MDQIIDILRFFAISQLLLLILLLIRSGGRRQEVGVAVLFCLSVIGYLCVKWKPLEGQVLYYVLLIPNFALPFSFWLFSKALFDDNFRLKAWMFGVLAGIILMDLGIHFQVEGQIINLSENGNTLLRMVHHAFSLFFIILAILEATRNRKADLIVSRFRFRNIFIFLAAILMVLTNLTEIAFPRDNIPAFLNLIQKITIFGLTLYFALQRLEFKHSYFWAVQKSPASAPQPEINEKLVAHLLHLMDDQKVYRTEGLSIRQLAAEMEVKEYKLRQAINQHLGFRNFNRFLNSYRIEEACEILADPKKQDLTILEIAYQMGYHSLSPFNKAFKQMRGMTPTEYRRENK